MRLVRHETYRVMPWKNGGGITREIALFPTGSDGGDFLWRLSLATVSASGPFSRFAGVDRSIACLAGGGMRLSFADGREVLLQTGGDPFAFAGEDAIEADCLDGETVDLNAMSRRPAWRHAMTRLVVEDRITLTARGDAGAVFFGGPARLIIGDETLEARAHDCLLTEGNSASVTIEPVGRLVLFVISLTREAAPDR